MTNPDDLAAENARLREQVAALTEERDAIHKAFLGQLAKSDPGLTEEDMASAIPSGPWLKEFLDRMVAGDPNAADSIPSAKKGGTHGCRAHAVQRHLDATLPARRS